MTFKPAQRIKHVRKSAVRRLYDRASPGSINLGLGEPDFQTPGFIRERAVDSIRQEFNGYTQNAGLGELRDKIATYHQPDFAATLTRDSVCVTSGVQEALFAIVMSIAEPGDEVLLPDPGFLAYPTLVDIAGATVTRYHLPAASRFLFDAASFDRAVTDRTKLVLVNSPSNPTGQTLSGKDLAFIAERLHGTGAYVVSDEIYRELHHGERPPSIAHYYDKTIVVSGLSKMMSMTGWRIGWAVGPDEAIGIVTVMHMYVSTCAATISQKAALAALTAEGRAGAEAMRIELMRRHDVMCRAIERELKLPYVSGDGAFYVMLDVSRYGRSEEVAESLLNSRVITVPGGAFGSHGEGYLRLSYSIETASIEEGIRRIADGLRLQ